MVDTLDNYSLVECGKNYFHDPKFQFLNEDQKDFAVAILLGKRKVVGLQAATAFDKSLTFILPMMALKNSRNTHYVHSVCVPYQSLKLATIVKLEKGGLTAKDISFFNNENISSDVNNVDVYVGCLESFTNGNLGSIFKNWKLSVGSRTKLGYLVFDEAHTLYTDAFFRPSVIHIKNLSWFRWEKILFLSATMPESLYEKIVEETHTPLNFKSTKLYINCVNSLPAKRVDVEVVQCVYKDILPSAVNMIKCFVNNTSEGKCVFFFSSKSKLNQVYKEVNSMKEVLRVDADCKDTYKRAVFSDFEDVHSKTRVILGTKLLSNELDCKNVWFICLLDCSLNCIDYLQMIGRIRKWGYVKVLANVKGVSFTNTSEQMRRFPNINWDGCVSQQVATFYSIDYSDHYGCCGHQLNDPDINKLKEKLNNEIVEIETDDDMLDGVIDLSDYDSSRVEEVAIEKESNIVKDIKGLINNGSVDSYYKNINSVLGCYHEGYIGDFILGINPIYVLKWEGLIPPNLCDGCLMTEHSTGRCDPFNKIVAGLIYQYLVLERVLKGSDGFISELNLLVMLGAHLFFLKKFKNMRSRTMADIINLDIALGQRRTKHAIVKEEEVDCVNQFQHVFKSIMENKMNVIKLMVNNTVEESPLWYERMDNYYHLMFKHSSGSDDVLQTDDSAMFAVFKKVCLSDLEAWYCQQLEDSNEEEAIVDLIGSLEYMPVLVTMI